MFVWMSGLLDISRMWYTENQRRYFFEKVDSLYSQCCVRAVKELLPPSKNQQVEQKINDGADINDWWDSDLFSGYDLHTFNKKLVYPAMFDELEENVYYRDEVFDNAPAENMKDWYKCSVVKSLLHEFVNDEEDPYKLNDRLSDKEIACFSYTVCRIYADYMKQHLHIDDEDADRLLKLLYCGEFAQNEWLNIVNGEHINKIQNRVTRRFLRSFLFNNYNMGMDPFLFSEFLNDEIISPIYNTIYNSRHEILAAGRKYLAENEDNRWSPHEMDNFCNYVIENVKLEFEAPDFDGYR